MPFYYKKINTYKKYWRYVVSFVLILKKRGYLWCSTGCFLTALRTLRGIFDREWEDFSRRPMPIPSLEYIVIYFKMMSVI